MTRILTIIALLFATPVHAQFFGKSADWTLVLEGRYGKYYLDRNSIKVRGNIFDFKMLMDWPKPENGDLSTVWTQSLDCSKLLWKNKAVENWTGNMASGKNEKVAWPADGQYWDDVDPIKNVDFYNLVKKLCSD